MPTLIGIPSFPVHVLRLAQGEQVQRQPFPTVRSCPRHAQGGPPRGVPLPFPQCSAEEAPALQVGHSPFLLSPLQRGQHRARQSGSLRQEEVSDNQETQRAELCLYTSSSLFSSSSASTMGVIRSIKLRVIWAIRSAKSSFRVPLPTSTVRPMSLASKCCEGSKLTLVSLSCRPLRLCLNSTLPLHEFS